MVAPRSIRRRWFAKSRIKKIAFPTLPGLLSTTINNRCQPILGQMKRPLCRTALIPNNSDSSHTRDGADDVSTIDASPFHGGIANTNGFDSPSYSIRSLECSSYNHKMPACRTGCNNHCCFPTHDPAYTIRDDVRCPAYTIRGGVRCRVFPNRVFPAQCLIQPPS